MLSLGREPQGPGSIKIKSRGAATENERPVAAALAAAKICRPSGAHLFFGTLFLGLTPQAKHLSRLRRSVAGIMMRLTGKILRRSVAGIMRSTGKHNRRYVLIADSYA